MSKAKKGKGSSSGPGPTSPTEPDDRLPPANMIERMYLEVLEETLTPPEVRKRLVESQSLEQKWRFIQIHKPLSEQKQTVWDEKEQNLLNTINNSRNPDIMSVLNLKVLLSSANRELMASFLDNGGVAVLLKVILQKVNKKPINTVDVALLYEILLCCKLVMNNAIGMKGFLDVTGSIDTIALCLLFDYKPLALLVLEILSASCYSEESTALVVHGVRLFSRSHHEAPYASLNSALLQQDIEVKTAVLQFIISVILGANIDTHSQLKKDLNNLYFDITCQKALQQVISEIESIEELQTVATPILNYQKAISANLHYSPKKVVNVDKLSSLSNGQLVALKGLRNSAIRGQFSKQASETSEMMMRTRARETLMSDFHKAGRLSFITTITGCLSSNSKMEERWCTLDGEFFRKYSSNSEQSTVEKFVYISDIKDIRTNTSDRSLYRMAEKAQKLVIEIITGSEMISMACETSEHGSWINAFSAARDQMIISKSSYYMNRTHLELKDALRVAERFKKLHEQYVNLTLEEKRFEMDTFGFDLNNMSAVFQFLQHQTIATGQNLKLLNILQELLLVPASSEGMWEAIILGLRNLRRIQSRVLDSTPTSFNTAQSAFEDNSISDLLSKKAEEEGSAYKDMSKLALNSMTLLAENSELKAHISELQNSLQAVQRVLDEGSSEEKKVLVEREEEMGRLRQLVEQSAAAKALDDEQILYLSVKLRRMEEEIERLREENARLASERSTGGPATGGMEWGERFEKYVKMKKLLPEGAVRQKMMLDNFSEREIELFFSNPSPGASAPSDRGGGGESFSSPLDGQKQVQTEGGGETPVSFSSRSSLPPLAPLGERGDRYLKYKMMRERGLPEGAVRQKMKLDNFTDEEIEQFFSSAPERSESTPKDTAEREKKKTEVVEEEKKEEDSMLKYRMMRERGLPEGAVRQKMKMDGLSAQDADKFFGVTSTSPPDVDAPSAALPLLSAPQAIRFNKYDKLRSKLSLDELAEKMREEGVEDEEREVFLLHIKQKLAQGESKKGAEKAKTSSVVKAGDKVKLKNLFWSKLSVSELKDTVWVSLPAFSLPAQELSLLEASFSSQPAQGARRASLPGGVGAGAGGAGGGGPWGVMGEGLVGGLLSAGSGKAVSLLDGKRTQNILIFMGKLRKSPEDILSLIWNLDSVILSQDTTSTLLSLLPSPEEEKAIKDFPPTSYSTLDNASKLVFQFTRLPRIRNRLDCQELFFSFPSLYAESQQKLQIFHTALDELKKSQPQFNTLLSIVLALGNSLNRDTKFGEARGVRLDSLLKLGTLKSSAPGSNSNKTLLHVVADTVHCTKQAVSPPPLEIGGEWVALHVAADLSFKQFLSDIDVLDKAYAKLQQELQLLKENKIPLDMDFVLFKTEKDAEQKNPLFGKLRSFLAEYGKKMGKLKGSLQSFEQNIEIFMLSYGEKKEMGGAVEEGEEGGGDGVKKFLNTIVNFVKNLRKAHEENERRRLALERAAEKEREKEREKEKERAREREKENKAPLSLAPPHKQRSASLPGNIQGISLPSIKPSMPAENIFNRFHSLQEEDSDDILAKYKLKLSVRHVENPLPPMKSPKTSPLPSPHSESKTS